MVAIAIGLVFSALLTAAIWGAVCALLVLCGGVLCLLVWHMRHMVRLMRWAAQPLNTPTPRAFGSWEHVFAALARRSRVAYAQREALSESLARFRSAAQAMPDGVLHLNVHDGIDWMNFAAAAHFGLDAQKDVGAILLNLVRQPELTSWLRQGTPTETLLLRGVRGQTRVLSLQVVQFGDDLRMLLSRDITQLERLETMRRDFVANVSHELKTPLTVMHGFQEILLDESFSLTKDELHGYLTLCQEQSVRMQRLIEDLLALAALETAAAVTEDEEIDALALLRAVAQDTRRLSAGRHEVVVNEGAAAQVLGAYTELWSAVSNLASNAVRYTPEGGRIRLSWQASGEQGAAAWVVDDNGEGIPREHLPRLTERFYRVDRSRSRGTGGTGLGLAIVKHVVNRHQGQLLIESEPGRGSRFSVQLPAQRVLWQTTAED